MFIYTKVAETTKPTFIQKLAQYGLGLEDIHGLTIRHLISSIVDCDLKTLVKDFVSKNFYLPSEATMSTKLVKPKYNTSNARYLAGALKSSLKYLTVPSESAEVVKVLTDFLPTIESELKKFDQVKKKAG